MFTVKFVALAAFTLLTCFLAPVMAQDSVTQPEPYWVWVELVNVTIPPDSPHRTGKDTPNLTVTVKRNGKQMGGRSTWDLGWSVDFERGLLQNQWPIRCHAGDRYEIQVWDYSRIGTNKLIYNLTGLAGEDFLRSGVVLEVYPKDRDRQSTIEWREVDPPDSKQK